ncbi:MAG: FKBP-type peptidyl-prolyl cis-trans isomerase [Pirellulaceae bacterium]|jgi:FKBP-type peptidyl-prolyl cis-trans isomerase
MKSPRSLNITDRETGTGRPCVPGDVAICSCICTRRKGDVLFASEPESPYRIRVGARDCCVGIEYGLLGMRVGGRRTVAVPPNLTDNERKTFRDLPVDAMLVYDIHLIDLTEKWDADMERRLSNRGDLPQAQQDGR